MRKGVFLKPAACVGVLKCLLMAVDFYLVCYGAPVLIERTLPLRTMQFTEHTQFLGCLVVWCCGVRARMLQMQQRKWVSEHVSKNKPLT